MSALYANSPLLFPHGVWMRVQSGEIKYSFEYCEFLKASRPRDVKYPPGWSSTGVALIQHDPADVRWLLNMGGELQ